MLIQAESLKRIVSAILEKGGSSKIESQVVVRLSCLTGNVDMDKL